MSNINSVWMNCTIAWFFVTFIFTSKKLYKSSTLILNHGNVFKKKKLTAHSMNVSYNMQ